MWGLQSSAVLFSKCCQPESSDPRSFIVYFTFMYSPCEWVSLSLFGFQQLYSLFLCMHFIREESMLFVFVFKIHTWELPGTTTVWFWCQWADPRERTGLRLGLMRFMRPSSRAFKQRLLSKVTTLLIHNACQHVRSWSRDSNWWPLVHRVQQ